LVRLDNGTVSQSYLKSTEGQALRTRLVLRERLILQRMAVENVIKAAFRLNGGRLIRCASATSLRREVDAEIHRLWTTRGIDLFEDLEPVIQICEALRRHGEQTTKQFRHLASDIEVCKRFLEIPGVGALTALWFYVAIETPDRFNCVRHVGAYLGLVPRVYQSGEYLKRSGISKRGCRMTRKHLYGAAGKLMLPKAQDTELKAWALQLKERIGGKRARIAVARKLATIMLSMWKTGQSYRAFSPTDG
jgi:transposase